MIFISLRPAMVHYPRIIYCSGILSPYSTQPIPKLNSTIWDKIKDEAKHYYHGSKLFTQETRHSLQILSKIATSKTPLLRREKFQLSRTTSDMIRLVPFSVFVIVPFLELLLPFFIKLFPNMLPSTFETNAARQGKLSNYEKAQIESSKYIHDMLENLRNEKMSSETVNEKLSVLFREYRIVGQSIPTETILSWIQVTPKPMMTWPKPELQAVCIFLGISRFGTVGVLINRIQKRIAFLEQDDILLDQEGVSVLTVAELTDACVARGIPILHASAEKMRIDLQQWLDLRFTHQSPVINLLLAKGWILHKSAQ